MQFQASLLSSFRWELRMRSLRSVASALILASFALSLDVSHGQQSPNMPARDVVNWPPMNTVSNPVPDANRFLESSLQLKESQKRNILLNIQRQKDMTLETAELLKLASELKAETDHSSRNQLSVVELRKAELIEKLAKNVRSKMAEWNDIRPGGPQ